jgi:hypothetical protein
MRRATRERRRNGSSLIDMVINGNVHVRILAAIAPALFDGDQTRDSERQMRGRVHAEMGR